jgi:centrosomal protein CEP104
MAGKSGEGFQVEAVMAFVNPGLSNSSAEVRGAAIALTLQVAQLAGPSVQRLLPADLNSKVKEQIEAGLLNPTAALAAGPLAALRVSPGPARAAAAGARQQQQPPAAAGSRQQPSPSPPAATTMQQQQQPPQQQQHYPAAPPPPGAADDDPAVYEAEVRAREARLGSSHPDVAEAICNLAIVHNQVRCGRVACWVDGVWLTGLMGGLMDGWMNGGFKPGRSCAQHCKLLRPLLSSESAAAGS